MVCYLLKLESFPIKFIIEGVGQAEGELNRIKAPHSVENIWYSLPISGRVKIQDNAFAYFLTNIQVKPEHPTFIVKPGDVTYWPMSKAICVFWQSTKPYSEVNIIGRVTNNLNLFQLMKNLTRITLEKR